MINWNDSSRGFSIPRSFMKMVVNKGSKIVTSGPKHCLMKERHLSIVYNLFEEKIKTMISDMKFKSLLPYDSKIHDLER